MCFKFSFFFILFFSIFCSISSWSFTNIQTTTSLGSYRDYQKNEHYPLYHSWSIKGIYANGLETSIDFFANNDFSQNEWSIQPTQVLINFPIYAFYSNGQNILTEVKLGRMMFVEGFDLALLDGGELLWRWSLDGGIMPFAGYLRATDFSDSEILNAPAAGLVAWESFGEFNLRAGYVARDTELTHRLLFGALQKQFVDLPLQPSLLLKSEWLADKMSFNQSRYELALKLTEKVDVSIDYSNLEPRPLNALDSNNFVYKIFAASPTETTRANLAWAKSEDFLFSMGGESSLYNSGNQNETAHGADMSLSWQWGLGDWITPSLSYLKSYGGEISDFGLRYTSELSVWSKLGFEFNTAYMKKINQIEGWAQNIRTTYETHFWDRAKLGFAVEVERNQYYIFDARAQVYVTNYL